MEGVLREEGGVEPPRGTARRAGSVSEGGICLLEEVLLGIVEGVLIG